VDKINLKTGMIPNASKLLAAVLPTQIDTDILKPYEDMLPKDGIIDANNAVKYATAALEAVSIAKLYARVCRAFFLAARKECQKQEAIIYFDAENILEKQGFFAGKDDKAKKVTDGTRGVLVDSSESVLAAKDLRNSWEVLADYFDNSMFDFKDRHNWYKSIFEKDVQTGDNITGE
jgi:hypothetical protein